MNKQELIERNEEKILFAMEFATWLNNSKVEWDLLPCDFETPEMRLWKREELMRIFLAQRNTPAETLPIQWQLLNNQYANLK